VVAVVAVVAVVVAVVAVVAAVVATVVAAVVAVAKHQGPNIALEDVPIQKVPRVPFLLRRTYPEEAEDHH
jgi:hypothetical protein